MAKETDATVKNREGEGNKNKTKSRNSTLKSNQDGEKSPTKSQPKSQEYYYPRIFPYHP